MLLPYRTEFRISIGTHRTFICFYLFTSPEIHSCAVRVLEFIFLYVFSCGNVLARPFANKNIGLLYISRQPTAFVDEDAHLLARLNP
jgi:hypothetical protein